MLENKKLYSFDFDGSCAPRVAQMYNQNTFSVGIFQWIPKSKKGLKRSAVIYRIKGYTSDPEAVYGRAREVCAMFQRKWALDAKFKPDKKSEKI